ncbi:MAG: succinate dehydrogenase, cytochrome b556 subunit [Pseudomonadota bacterium]
MPNKNDRPVFLDLRRIHLPVNALVSIAHRISGLLLFLAIPLVILLLSLSLRDEDGYVQARALLDGGAMKLLALLVLWALAHHVLAGLRFLLIDLGVGVDRDSSRRSAWLVNIASAIALLVLGGILFS